MNNSCKSCVFLVYLSVFLPISIDSMCLFQTFFTTTNNLKLYTIIYKQ